MMATSILVICDNRLVRVSQCDVKSVVVRQSQFRTLWMVISWPLISAHAVCATSGCHARSLFGFNVNHHAATSAHAPKTIPSVSSFPRTKMMIPSSVITKKML